MVSFTDEQEDIIGSTSHDYTFVQAFAGTGKTTTLLEYANRNSSQKILYLTFNTSLANCENIKNTENIDSYTIHGFAFQELGYEEIEINKMSLKYLRNLYDVDTRYANSIRRAFNYFLASTNRKPKIRHVLETDNTGLQNPEEILNFIIDLYDGMESGKYDMSHDFYLKKYILMKPVLKYDIILVDESQDLSPCVLKLLAIQDCKRVFVGDVYQQIYQFRNVINPFDYMDQFDDSVLLHLTKTFRYGHDVCELSNAFLGTYTTNKSKIVCASECKTDIYSNSCTLPSKYTFISRTNRGLIDKAVELSKKNQYFDLFDKMYNFKKEKEIYELLSRSTKKKLDSELSELVGKKFGHVSSLDELKDLVIEFQNFKWLNRILICEKYKENIWELIETHFVKDSDIILMNAHQSKGLEFDNVVLGNDFKQLVHKTGKYSKFYQEDEYNLLYVAMTRAKKRLYINENIKKFLRKYYDNSIERKYGITNRCHECGCETDMIISHTMERLPDYVRPNHRISVHYCSLCADGYIDSITADPKFYRK